MTPAERTEIILLLCSKYVDGGEATEFNALLKEAHAQDLRDAIHQVLLTPSAASCNRRRMGKLATQMVTRIIDGHCELECWKGRALAAEEKLDGLQRVAAAEAALHEPAKPTTTAPRKRKAAR